MTGINELPYFNNNGTLSKLTGVSKYLIFNSSGELSVTDGPGIPQTDVNKIELLAHNQGTVVW